MSNGNGPGVGKCPAPGQCEICKCPTPGTDKVGKCPAVALEEGGGWAQLELTDALLKHGYRNFSHNLYRVLWWSMFFFIVIFYLFISTEYFNTEYCTRVRVKFGNIMSGFPKCYDCRESHLLCDIYRKR